MIWPIVILGAPGEFHHPGLGLGLGLRFRVRVSVSVRVRVNVRDRVRLRVRVRDRDRDRVRDRGGEILRERRHFELCRGYGLGCFSEMLADIRRLWVMPWRWCSCIK